MNKNYYVYIVSSFKNRVLYIGITSDLKKRIWEHKQKMVRGFTQKYNVDRLVYYEVYDDPQTAIQREKNMKDWKRDWKVKRIENLNPEWNDLYGSL